MASWHLSDELKARGASVVATLDSIELEPQGALWLHFPHIRDWRFTIITDLIDTIGRKRVYDLVGAAFDQMGPVEGLTVFDLHLAAPSEVLPTVLGGTFLIQDGLVELKDVNINGVHQIDAVIYRMREPRSSLDAKKAANRFQKKVVQLTN